MRRFGPVPIRAAETPHLSTSVVLGSGELLRRVERAREGGAHMQGTARDEGKAVVGRSWKGRCCWSSHAVGGGWYRVRHGCWGCTEHAGGAMPRAGGAGQEIGGTAAAGSQWGGLVCMPWPSWGRLPGLVQWGRLKRVCLDAGKLMEASNYSKTSGTRRS